MPSERTAVLPAHPAEGLSHALSVLTAANSVVTGTMTEREFAAHLVGVCDEFPTTQAAAAHIAMAAVALLRGSIPRQQPDGRRSLDEAVTHALTATGAALVTHLSA